MYTEKKCKFKSTELNAFTIPFNNSILRNIQDNKETFSLQSEWGCITVQVVIASFLFPDYLRSME